MSPISTPSKVLLVAATPSRAAVPGGVRVRRYRLARLRLDGRASGPESRFEHLKRVYD